MANKIFTHIWNNPAGSCGLHKGWVRLAGIVLLLFILSILPIQPAPVLGQEEDGGWKLVSQIGGTTQAVAFGPGTVYAGIGMQLSILDVRDPELLVQIGSSEPFPDFIQDIAVSKQLAYVAAGAGGIGIVDVSDVTRPVLLGTSDTAGYASGIDVNDSTVFLADGANGLRIFDVSSPDNPVEIGSAFPFSNALDVDVTGNYACLAAGDEGLLIADISDPANPVELGRLDTDGYAYGIKALGRTVYIADGWEGIQVFDITNPENPVLVSNTSTDGWALSVDVAGIRLYTGNGGGGIQVFKTTRPDLTPEGAYFGNGSARRVAVSGSTIYVADTLKGLRIINASDPHEPFETGLYSSLSYARRVTIAGDYAYVATGADGAMVVLNVADPEHPFQVSRFQADGNASEAVIYENHAYLGTFMASTNYLVTIDISDPGNLSQASVVPLGDVWSSAARDLDIQGHYLYSADEWGLHIFDISSPQETLQISGVPLSMNNHPAVGVTVAGDYAYVSDSGNGLQVVNISDLSNPFVEQTFSLAGHTASAVISDNILYISNSGDGVTTAEVETPGMMPVRLDNESSLSQVEGVSYSDGELFASEGLGGVEVFDVSNPSQITLNEVLETPGYTWDTTAAGDYLYVADGHGGVLIFKKQGGLTAAEEHAGQPSNGSGVISTTTYMQDMGGMEAPVFPANVQRVTSESSCVVTTTANSGPGSLFECINTIRAGGTITFDPAVFPADSPATILLDSQLPELDDGSVTIDASNAGVIVDGNQVVDFGLRVTSSYNTVMGLQLTHFTRIGISVEYPGQYNVIGGDHFIGDGPSGQGNVLAGNYGGISLSFSTNNTIIGNFVGTNAGGTAAGEMNEQGITINDWARYNQIGGAAEGEKNIISGNNRGVDIASNTSAFNIVAGNFIGTDITGTYAVPNYDWGVILEVGTKNNTIGGTTDAERNIISGNENGWGICISDDETTQNSVIGNYIGLDVSGEAALPNGTGVTIFQATFNRIGGTQPGETNLISGNRENAVSIYGMGSINAIVLGNTIGLDVNGNTVGNGSAVWVYGGMHSFIGGLTPEAGNLMIGNRSGVRFEGAGTEYNRIAGNTISEGQETGIRISNLASYNAVVQNTITGYNPGVSISNGTNNSLRANRISTGGESIQIGDGGNLELAAPVLKSAAGGGVTGTACTLCLVEVFSDSGQEWVYEGYTLADEAGAFMFPGSLSGKRITATATDPAGNTSAFSVPLAVP